MALAAQEAQETPMVSRPPTLPDRRFPLAETTHTTALLLGQSIRLLQTTVLQHQNRMTMGTCREHYPVLRLSCLGVHLRDLSR